MKFDRIGIRDIKVNSMKVVALNKTFCPNCNAGPLDGITGMTTADDTNTDETQPKDDGSPKDGSPTICVYCGELLVFKTVDGNFTLARPTALELDAFKSDENFWKMISEIKKIITDQKVKSTQKIPNKRF